MSNVCPDCGATMSNAGPLGDYCPNKICPGIEKSLKLATNAVAVLKEQEAVQFLKSRGYSVERSADSAVDKKKSARTTALSVDWVPCLICGEPDMEKTQDEEDHALIYCVNYACASNGGTYSLDK